MALTDPVWAAHLPPGMRPDDLDLLADGTIIASWLRHVAAEPGRPAVFDDEHGWTSAGELEELSRRAAAGLHALGLGQGDCVVTCAPASLDLVTTHVAALRLGLVVAPLNPALSEREVGHVLGDARPRAALVARGWTGASTARAAGVPVHDLADLRRASPGGRPGAAALDRVRPGDDALLVYTSGTTGAPKGALLTHGNLLASAEALRLAWRWTGEDRLVLSLPLFHLHGLGVGLHGTLHAGSSVVLRPRFSPDDVLDAARGHRATMFFGVPTMYGRLAASGRVGELHELRLCVSGSAALPPRLFREIRHGAGQAILERYGMSETLMTVSNPHDGERRPGTVGLPLPGLDLRLDGGGDAGVEGGGEILVRGPSVFAGYLGRPEATSASFDGGWFRTGDVGELDAAGYLRIVGRLKELIISGGFNVYPREVEDVLRSHPGVLDAAVVGTPSPEWGEEVTAFVEGDVDPDALRAHAAARLAPYKRPRVVHVVRALPRNALGKVVKGELGAGSGGFRKAEEGPAPNLGEP